MAVWCDKQYQRMPREPCQANRMLARWDSAICTGCTIPLSYSQYKSRLLVERFDIWPTAACCNLCFSVKNLFTHWRDVAVDLLLLTQAAPDHIYVFCHILCYFCSLPRVAAVKCKAPAAGAKNCKNSIKMNEIGTKLYGKIFLLISCSSCSSKS